MCTRDYCKLLKICLVLILLILVAELYVIQVATFMKSIYFTTKERGSQKQTSRDINCSTSSVGLPCKSVKMPRVRRLKKSTKTHDRVMNSDISKGRNRSILVCKIGILIPSCTRTMKSPVLSNLTLITKCIPSIYKFMETKYSYIIFVGIDKGDFLESVRENIEGMFDKVKVVVTNGGSFTKTVNAIAREAYKDNIDYLVRINDDTTFETFNWTSQGIHELQRFSPPNIGVVGPTCKQGNDKILTHDMVHRTHLKIFDFYYPPYFENWWTDDWITKVYQPNRSTKLKKWKVIHHVSAKRYNVDYRLRSKLAKTLMFDKERLSEYLSSTFNNNHSHSTI